ncbi:hypothetical protein LguiA_026232 [Lonicera macranthoides]
MAELGIIFRRGLSFIKIVCVQIAPLLACGRQQPDQANRLARHGLGVDSTKLKPDQTHTLSLSQTHTHMPTMLRRSILVSCFAMLVLVQFPQTPNGKQNGYCKPSSCGNIHNISYPFRLKGDPENCGDPRYELACEDDLNLMVLYSRKYFVQAINYLNFTIRLVDSTIKKDNCSSLPLYSLIISDFKRGDAYSPYDYRWGRMIKTEISKPIYSIKCPYRVNSPLYVGAAPCINGTRRNSTTTSFSYLKFGHMNASDLLDSCSIELMVTSSWPVKDESGLSLSDIRDALLYGFELSWFNVLCKSCSGEYNYCYLDHSNKGICYSGGGGNDMERNYDEFGSFVGRFLIPIEQPLIFPSRNLQLQVCKLVDEFKNYKSVANGSIIENFGLAIMDLAALIQHCGIKLSVEEFIDKIAETLPVKWDKAKKYIFEHKKPTYSIGFL